MTKEEAYAACIREVTVELNTTPDDDDLVLVKRIFTKAFNAGLERASGIAGDTAFHYPCNCREAIAASIRAEMGGAG